MSRLPATIQPTGNTTYIVPRTVLKVEGLVKIYGQRRVVDGVSFHVNKGEVVGLLGPNGAGKTTSFRMACGLIDANAGIVFLNGNDVTNWPLYRRAKEGGMGYLPQNESVFRQLTVQDNLFGMMEMLRMDSKTRHAKCDMLLEKMKLTMLRKNLAKGLSGGERRRLEIARALVADPKIILLDEPFAAIDPITVQSLQTIIRQLCSEGISILITDHSVRETLQITDRSYIIEAGKVLCFGTPDEVLANEAAQRAYFGQSATIDNTLGSKHSKRTPDNRYGGKTSKHETSDQPRRRSSAYESPEQNDSHDYAFDDEHDHFPPSRHRPSVKVRNQQSPEQDRSIRKNRVDHGDDTNKSYDGSNDLRPPKYETRPDGVRRRAADHADGYPANQPADEKPTPRMSLLGRISGIFKKPSE